MAEAILWCVFIGLMAGVFVSIVMTEFCYWGGVRRTKKLRAQEAAERERQALAQELKVMIPTQIYGSTAREAMISAFMDATYIPTPPPPEPIPPPPVPPTLDVLAATAQQNPERWKDFLDV